ncbi:MAG: FixH family protein [Acidiferrobacteraceae bacterium]|jgi:hypothetical protein
MIDNKNSPPWYREPYVWLIILIPASAVVYGFLFLRLALVSNDGLVDDDYYQHGKEINRVLDRDRAATSLGLTARGKLDLSHGTISLWMHDGTNTKLPQELTLKLMHATRAGFDQHVVLQRSPDGRYFGLVSPLELGHWYLQLGTKRWRLTGSLFLPGDAGFRLAPEGT